MISEKELESSLQGEKLNPNQFFQPLRRNEINMVKAEQALACVIDADYPELEAIFQNNPSLMFAKATIMAGDETIETTPLQYAIDHADSYTWKICENICQENRKIHPEFEALFNERKIANPINLQPLYDAYEKYLTMFNECKKQYTQDIMIDPRIQESFLAVGKMQQTCMPRHLLREMCQASVRSSLRYEEYDLVLLNLEPDTGVNLKLLKKISEQHQKSPVLIKQDTRTSIYGHSGDTYRWQITHLMTDPFQSTEFPCDYLKPQVLTAHLVTKGMLKSIRDREYIDFADFKGHTESWNEESQFSADNAPHPGTMIILRTLVRNADTEPFLVDDPGWGTEFVLSRGGDSVCLAVYSPFGNCALLGYRMAEDLKILKHIMEIRTAERDQKFQYALPENAFSFS